MRVTEEEFRRIAIADPTGQWELHCGELRQKPAMTIEHNWAARELGRILTRQLDPQAFEVAVNLGHVHHAPSRYYIPDVYVVPVDEVRRLWQQGRALEAYDEPLPLVVEVWSPSTGAYDITEKLAQYQHRGDLEIWRIHPYDRTLIAWRRQPDGSYSETLHTGGVVQPIALPNCAVDLPSLFVGPPPARQP